MSTKTNVNVLRIAAWAPTAGQPDWRERRTDFSSRIARWGIVLVATFSAVCGRPVFGGPSTSDNAAGEQQRFELMKARGSEASLTILPVMIRGTPFIKASQIVGVLLERNGLQTIEVSSTPFCSGVKADMPALSAALSDYLKTNSLTTEYVLYAEFNGPTFDELRAVIADKSGELVWTDIQTTQDKDFQALQKPRDPMTLAVFLVERLAPQFNLNEDSTRKRSHKLEDQFMAASGYGPASEVEDRMPARLKKMKDSHARASMVVLGVRVEGAASVEDAADLAKRISTAKLYRSVVAAKEPILLKTKFTGPDQLKYLWALAREFQACVKEHPPEADYAVYADYLFDRQNWTHGAIQYIVCDRSGDWVIVALVNSDHEDYRRIKPISADGCDHLVIERLEHDLR